MQPPTGTQWATTTTSVKSPGFQRASLTERAGLAICVADTPDRPTLAPAVRNALGLEALRVACDAVQRQAELTTVRLFPRLFPTRAALRPGCSVPPHHAYTRFHSVTYPETTLYELAAALSQRTGFGTDVLMSALVLAARAGAAMPEGQMTAHQVHRLFLAATVVVHKVVWDRPYAAPSLSKATGLSTLELMVMEFAVMALVDWRTQVTADHIVRLVEWARETEKTPNDVVSFPPIQPEIVVLVRADEDSATDDDEATHSAKDALDGGTSGGDPSVATQPPFPPVWTTSEEEEEEE